MDRVYSDRDRSEEQAPAPASGAGPGDGLLGQRLGQFRIVERIRREEMGDVYRGYDESLARDVAVKVLAPELAQHADFVRRFRDAATAVAKVAHPNVTSVHFIGADAGRHFFAMQFVEGELLSERLRRRQAFSVEEALDIVEQCLAGLEAIHDRGLIHGSVRPENITLDGRTGRVLLANFGLVRKLDVGADPTACGAVMGTGDYVSPEQARGREIDRRTDIYSLGVVFYELLAGRLPFEADTAVSMIFQHAYEAPLPLEQAAPDVPEPVVHVVRRMMAKAVDDRYPHCAAVLDDLRRFRGRPRSSPPSSDLVEAVAVDEPGGAAAFERGRDRLARLLQESRRAVAALSKKIRKNRRMAALLVILAVLVSLRIVLVPVIWRVMNPVGQQTEGYASYVPPPLVIPPRVAAPSLMDRNILYMTFEPESFERAGGLSIVKDCSGHGHHGVVLGPTATKEGRVGQALYLNGDGNCVDLPRLANSYLAEQDALTFSVWVHETRYGHYIPFLDSTTRRAKCFQLSRSSDDRGFRFEGPGRVFKACRVRGHPVGQWYHIVGVWDRAKTTLYVDGKLAAEIESSRDISHADEFKACLRIGCASQDDSAAGYWGGPPMSDFQGLVDEVAVFNRGLAAEEVRRLYEMGLKGERPPLPARDPATADFLSELAQLGYASSEAPKADAARPATAQRGNAAPETAQAKTVESGVAAPEAGPPAAPELSPGSKVAESRKSGQAWWDGNPHRITSLAVKSDHEQVACAEERGVISMRSLAWGDQTDLKDGQEYGKQVYRVAISGDDRFLVGCGETPLIHVSDFANWGEWAKTIDTGMAEVFALAISPDNRTLAAGGRAPRPSPQADTLGLWDVDSRKRVFRFDAGGRQVTSLAYSPDGRRILAATLEDHSLRLFDTSDGREIQVLEGHTGLVSNVKFLPSGHQALSGSHDKTLRLWDLDSGQCLYTMEGHTGKVTDVDVSPDGRLGASSSVDATCRLWDLQSGKCVRTCSQRTLELWCVKLLPDQDMVIAGCTDGGLWKWRLPPAVGTSPGDGDAQ